METIKKKINALKEDNEIKQDEIERLQEPFPIICSPYLFVRACPLRAQ